MTLIGDDHLELPKIYCRPRTLNTGVKAPESRYLSFGQPERGSDSELRSTSLTKPSDPSYPRRIRLLPVRVVGGTGAIIILDGTFLLQEEISDEILFLE